MFFQRDDLLKRQLLAELPIIIVNDWLTVRDVVHGGQIMGQIRVLMAAGLGTQIYRLMLLVDSTQSKASELMPVGRKEVRFYIATYVNIRESKYVLILFKEKTVDDTWKIESIQ